MKENEKDVILSVPLCKDFLMRKTNDKLYCYLLCKSFMDKKLKKRYLLYENFSFSSYIEETKDIDNIRTLKREFNALKDKGLIEIKDINKNNQTRKIIEIKEVKHYIREIPKERLDYLCKNFCRNTIKVYVYLLDQNNSYLKFKNEPYNFTKKDLIKNCLKLEYDRNEKNRLEVDYIVRTLREKNFIHYEEDKREGNKTSFKVYRLTKIGSYEEKILEESKIGKEIILKW